jgi:hypothetical protein
MAAPPARSGTVAFFAAPPTAFVALSAALPIAATGAGFDELDRFDELELELEFEFGLLAFGLDDLRLAVALVFDLGLVLVWAMSPPS